MARVVVKLKPGVTAFLRSGVLEELHVFSVSDVSSGLLFAGKRFGVLR